MTAAYFDDRRAVRDVVAGYGAMVAQRVAEGWSPYLATLMFAHVPGRPAAVVAQMHDEAERFYRRFLTRTVRRPSSRRSLEALSLFVVAPDVSVGKRDKRLVDVAINDGLHLHGILVVPARSRLPLPADEHVRQRQAFYLSGSAGPDGLEERPGRLLRLDVRPVDGNVERAVEYALKSVQRGRFSMDDLRVYPRALGEVRDGSKR